MATTETLDKEVKDLKRRMDLAETRLSQGDGRFEFVSGQLRDLQLFQQAKFAEVDTRLDRIEGRLDGIDTRLDRIDTRLERIDATLEALPRAIAEMIAANRSRA